MRILVIGGHDVRDTDWVETACESLGPSLLIHTAESGATSIAGNWARAHRIPELIYIRRWGEQSITEWIRKLLDEADPDVILHFRSSYADRIAHGASMRKIPVKSMRRQEMA